jgi:hypothetical protein
LLPPKIYFPNETIELGMHLRRSLFNDVMGKPHLGVLEQIEWTISLVIQTIITSITLPVSITMMAYLDALSTLAISAFLLSGAGAWKELDWLLKAYKSFLDGAKPSINALAHLGPTIGGSAKYYIIATEEQYAAFRKLTDKMLKEEEEK